MKIKRKSPSKLPLLLGATGVAIIAIGAVAYMWLKPAQQSSEAPTPTNTVNYGPATDQERQDSANAKQQANSDQQNPPTQTSNDISVSISHAAQVGATVSVRSIVNGTTSGSCAIKLSKSGQSDVTKTATITLQATSYVCNADIATSEFGASGDWQLSITATSGASTSPAAIQTVTVTK